MKVVTLLENSTINDKLENKHGLSLYIESEGLKILFDVGPDSTFFVNAEELGIEISDIDFLVISHGHSDHGGGLEAFLKLNQKARILMSKYAFDEHYVKILKLFKFNIGLDPQFKNNSRIEFYNNIVKINEKITLFNGITNNKLYPNFNSRLYKKTNNKIVLDNFDHEINLIITENQNNFLFSGCAHKGVLNIVEKATEIIGSKITAVFGGMHLVNPVGNKYESDKFIISLANELSLTNINVFYTGHCTGEKALIKLRGVLGDRIQPINTGTIIKI